MTTRQKVHHTIGGKVKLTREDYYEMRDQLVHAQHRVDTAVEGELTLRANLEELEKKYSSLRRDYNLLMEYVRSDPWTLASWEMFRKAHV